MPRTQLLLAKKHFFPATRKLARREGGALSPKAMAFYLFCFSIPQNFCFNAERLPPPGRGGLGLPVPVSEAPIHRDFLLLEPADNPVGFPQGKHTPSSCQAQDHGDSL